MSEKVKVSFSIPMYRNVYEIPAKIDSAAFEDELICKLKQVGIDDFRFEPEHILIGMEVYEGKALVMNCDRGLDMVALRIFMCLIVKYDSVLASGYYRYKWGDVFASLSIHSDDG